MAKIEPKQIHISGSDLQSGIPTAGGYNIGALNPTMSISDALNVVASEGSGTIGYPDDGTYTDGFFDEWTEDTRIPNAFDDVNELLGMIVPDQPGGLTGQDMTLINPGSTFSGYLSDGLKSADWYVDFVAGNLISNITSQTSQFVFESPDVSDRFSGGRTGSIASLVGGVTASHFIGNSSEVFVSSRSLSEGLGISGIIEITDISTYNSVWTKINVDIGEAYIQTGSIKYKMYADNGAGETNVFQLFMVGAYPNQSFGDSPYTSSVSTDYKYMSGISYYSRGTNFEIQYTADELANPVYTGNSQETRIISSYFTNTYSGFSSTPDHLVEFVATESITLSNDVKTSYNALGTFTVTLYKPGKSNVVSGNVNIGSRPINTYLTRSTDLLEYFDDEIQRWTAIDNQFWNPAASLVDGELEVNNGRLVDSRWSNYTNPIFGSSVYYYYRPFTPTIANENGTFEITRVGFGSITNIVGEWGGSDELQMVFTIANESGSSMYDLGREVGDNSGSVFGIRNGAISGDVITWALPSGKQVTPTNPLVLNTKIIRSTGSGDYLTKLTMTFDV